MLATVYSTISGTVKWDASFLNTACETDSHSVLNIAVCRFQGISERSLVVEKIFFSAMLCANALAPFNCTQACVLAHSSIGIISEIKQALSYTNYFPYSVMNQLFFIGAEMEKMKTLGTISVSL